MKRKLVAGRLDRGGDEGEGQQKDNPGVIELWYHRGRLSLVRTGEGNENLLWYAPLHLVGGPCIHFTLGWLPLKVDLENAIAFREGVDHCVFS
jgi:hypothetical protein